MGFDVAPDGLDALHRQLDRGSQDASAMRSYWEQHAGVSFTGEGILNAVQSADDKAERGIQDLLDALADKTMPGVSDAVAAAASYYRATDRATAERFDQTMPGVSGHLTQGAESIEHDYGPSAGHFADVVEPQQALRSQPDYNVEMPYQPSWTDLASPTSLLRDAIWVVTGLAKMLAICDRQYDIFEAVLKPVCGDWAGIKATGVTMNNLAEALNGLDINLGRAMIDLGGCWHGNAADAALENLNEIKTAINEAVLSLYKLGREYINTAEACYKMSGVIGNLLSDVTDAAIAAAAASAASGAIAATGAGVPISLVLGAIALTRVYKVVQAVWAVVHVIADMTSRVNAFVGTVQATGGNFGRFSGSFIAGSLPTAPALPR